MRYTRYDLKKTNNKTFMLLILLILALAFFFGTIIFKLFIGECKNNFKSDTSYLQNNVNSKDKNNESDSKVIKFIVIQGGIYKSKENAESEKSLLSSYGTPFSVEEDNKIRILLGIYTEDQGEKVIKSLNDQKVDNSKMIFEINKCDMCDLEISELINANIQILNKLSEQNVKAIQTSELKKWCLSLKKLETGSKNIKILNELKSYVNKMPNEISKDKTDENYNYLYQILKKVGTKNN